MDLGIFARAATLRDDESAGVASDVMQKVDEAFDDEVDAHQIAGGWQEVVNEPVLMHVSEMPLVDYGSNTCEVDCGEFG